MKISVKLKKPRLLFISLFFFNCFICNSFGQQKCLEKISYLISPVGESEYCDYGTLQFSGEKLNFCTFRTQVAGFDDTEKIFSNPKTDLPVKVERFIDMWFGKEYLTEDYDEKNCSLLIKKFEGKKVIQEYKYKEKNPIHNAILLPFSLRKIPDLEIGWKTDISLPDKFEVSLIAIVDVVVPAGKFRAYHFTSVPQKFEIWVSADEDRIPLKIKGMGGLGYTLVMKERVVKNEVTKSPSHQVTK